MRQRFDVRVVVVIVCVVLAAIAVTRTGHSVESQDVRTYLEMTCGVAAHGLPYLDNGPAERFPELGVPWNVFTGGHSWGIYGPLYPYYAAPFLLLGGLRLVSIATFALNIPIALLTSGLTRRLTGRADCAAAAAVVVAFSTPIAAKSFELTAYPLLTLSALGATWCAVVALECAPQRRWAWSAASGLLWAAAIAGHVLCFPMAIASIAALAAVDPRESGAPLRPTRRALTSGVAAALSLALGMMPLVLLNRARFGSGNPLSYGPVVWRGALLPAGLTSMTVVAHLRDASPVLAWASVTVVAFLVARSLPARRAAATGIVGLGAIVPLAASQVLYQKCLIYLRTAFAFIVDMTTMPLDATYPRAPGGFGFLFGPWTIKSTLQCTPIIVVVCALPFLRLDPRTRAKVILTLAPAVALYGYLTLRGNIELSAALGYPWVYIRYTMPALPMLVAASFVTLGQAPLTWRHAGLSTLIAIATASTLLFDDTDAPLYRRVLVLAIPCVVALVALACVLLVRFHRLNAGWATMAIALACGLGVGIGTGHDLRANVLGKRYCDYRVDLMARLAPRRFAVFGALPAMETVLALRAERDVEYADLGQLDDVREVRPLLQRWFDDGRPVFLVVDRPATSPWTDIVYEVLDEHEHIYAVRPRGDPSSM
jgi:hypothetical protein